jgi:hypothetical protein
MTKTVRLQKAAHWNASSKFSTYDYTCTRRRASVTALLHSELGPIEKQFADYTEENKTSWTDDGSDEPDLPATACFLGGTFTNSEQVRRSRCSDRLQAGKSGVWVTILRFSSGKGGGSVRLITHLHLQPRLRMSGTYFKAWTTLPILDAFA